MVQCNERMGPVSWAASESFRRLNRRRHRTLAALDARVGAEGVDLVALQPTPAGRLPGRCQTCQTGPVLKLLAPNDFMRQTVS
jgi:hypothetical protein